ncbi:hypothetical protein KSF78_0002721 [Schistosoma japonicum]|nr:hypothetical protein KSF78_0002721 [Schistosoma japonicum]KAH8863540.1 hypothetical protein KSF78_0002721 [Schistosoma japonicum]KAH8863541.1 hypothetical protein KSF78_0002721 [Schistosoma japonicum]KAH8863542.1 hypothetical protein KSF78_0002721 [Schistosoma japonicum]
MALINSNKADGDENFVENAHHLRSPSQSSVSSEELLIWSKAEGNDYDWELFSKVPPCNGEFGCVQNPLNIESENSYTTAANRHSDSSNDVSRSITVTEVNSSSSFSKNGGTTIHSSSSHNFSTVPLSVSPSTSQSCLYYMNGSTKGQFIHSTKTKMTKTTFSGLLPSSSFSTTSKSKNVIINHCTSSSNLPEKRNINMLADDFIDLDIKINPVSNSSMITYHPEIDCVSLQESPMLSSQNSFHNQKLLPLSLSACNNSVNIQKSNVIFQSPEINSIKQTSPNPQFDNNNNYQRQDSELIPLTMHNCIPLPIMLIPTSELASGDSLTCTVVNILIFLFCLGCIVRLRLDSYLPVYDRPVVENLLFCL